VAADLDSVDPLAFILQGIAVGWLTRPPVKELFLSFTTAYSHAKLPSTKSGHLGGRFGSMASQCFSQWPKQGGDAVSLQLRELIGEQVVKDHIIQHG
jgi:hypothetical protein